MRKTVCVLAAMATLTTAPASAGNLCDPIVAPLVFAQDTVASSSSSGTAIVLLLGLLVAIPAFID
jgi:hypothetical protein